MYLYSSVRNYVENPSLQVEDDRITIAARQIRSYSDRPVRNPRWTGAFGPFVPSARQGQALAIGQGNGCAHKGAVAYQRGFRQAWKKTPYECAPAFPADYVQRYEAEQPFLGETKAQVFLEEAYSYSRSHGHEPDWYYYLYEGEWDETDHIKVAQRPLIAGSWSKRGTVTTKVPRLVHNLVEVVEEQVVTETGWREGTWSGDTLQSWRIATLDSFESHEGEIKRCDISERAPTVARVGMSFPRVSGAPGGRWTVTYEKGVQGSRSPDGHVYNVFSFDGGATWSAPSMVGTGSRPDSAVILRDADATVFYAQSESTPATSSTGTQAKTSSTAVQLVLSSSTATDGSGVPAPKSATLRMEAGWNAIRPAWKQRAAGPRVVGFEDLMIVAWVAEEASSGLRQIVTTRAAAVESTEARFVLTAPERIAAGEVVPTKLECVDRYHMLSDACGSATSKKGTAGAARGDWPSGEGWVAHKPSQTVWTSFIEDRAPDAVLQALALDQVGLEVFFGEATRLAEAAGLHVVQDDAHKSWGDALAVLDALYSPTLGVQREYLGALDQPDSAFLAKHDRAWVYTQGIALAQYSTDAGRAQKMAHYLCDKARWSDLTDNEIITGWPFSWNTKSDNWADARSVTGANAWAVHGLGAYVATLASQAQASDPSIDTVLRCYLASLRGLAVHRRSGLMTAGYTTVGLKNARTPHVLGLETDPKVEWDYYDILDAIGYEEFDQDSPPSVARFTRNPDRSRNALGFHILTAEEFGILKRPAQAENVVTEHNLDLLSVLNQALQHWPDIAPLMLQRDQALVDELVQWRIELKNAIFEELWDPEEGRFMTGGRFVDGLFEAHRISAVDNCSWLVLAVDDTELSAEERNKLGLCLDYTIQAFVKEHRFNGGVYVGAHYFPNSFSDPYVEESNKQEELYHLEATAGLILALRKFARAHQDHPRVSVFRAAADALWLEMQRFVRDNGFPYSSLNISDVMTVLESSTAAIWYVDVFEDYERDGTFTEFVNPSVQSLRPPGLIRSKANTQMLKALTRKLDEFLQLPAELAALSAALPSVLAYTASLGTEIDPGLLSIFISNEAPSSELWEAVGYVRGEDLLAPFGTYFKDEEDIRAHVPIFSSVPLVDDPFSFSQKHFEDDKIYLLSVDFLGWENTPLGTLGVLDMQEDAVFEVYALRTEHPRSEIIEASVRQHLRWRQAEQMLALLPESVREMLLFWVELSIRGEFSRRKVEEWVRNPVFRPDDPNHRTHVTVPPTVSASGDGKDLPKDTPAIPVGDLKSEGWDIVPADGTIDFLGVSVPALPDPTMALERKKGDFEQMVRWALDVVARFQRPGEDNLFSWKGDRSPLEGKSLRIVVYRSTRPWVASYLGTEPVRDGLGAFTFVDEAPSSDSSRTDHRGEEAGLSFAGGVPEANSPSEAAEVDGTRISVVLVIDQLAFDSDHELRPDTAVRLIAALGHQIYGEVQRALEAPPGQVTQDSVTTYGEELIRSIVSYEASLAFLMRIMGAPEFEDYDEVSKSHYQTTFQEQAVTLSDLETALYEWNKVLAGEERPALDGVQISAIPPSDAMLIDAKKRVFFNREVVVVYKPGKGFATFPVFKPESTLSNVAHPMWQTVDSWGPGVIVVSVTGAKTLEREIETAWFLLKRTGQEYVRVVRADRQIRLYGGHDYSRDKRPEPLMTPDGEWSSDPLTAHRIASGGLKREEFDPWHHTRNQVIVTKPPEEVFKMLTSPKIFSKLFPDWRLAESIDQLDTLDPGLERRFFFIIDEKVTNKSLRGPLHSRQEAHRGRYHELRVWLVPEKGGTRIEYEIISGEDWWGRPE